MKTKIITAVVGIVIGLVAGFFLFDSENVLSLVSTSNSTTFSSAKIAEVGFSPATGSATSTSILNTDSNDRIVTGSFFYCNNLGTSYTAYTGAGLTSLGVLFKAATTSTAAPATVSNVNLVLSATVATTSAGSSVYVASTTTPFPNDVGRLWASGSYMTFFSNATNTATCVVGVQYLAS